MKATLTKMGLAVVASRPKQKTNSGNRPLVPAWRWYFNVTSACYERIDVKKSFSNRG